MPGRERECDTVNATTVEGAPDALMDAVVPADVSLEEILASAPGSEPGGIELTQTESDTFFDAMRI
jgi:hypothetical protein